MLVLSHQRDLASLCSLTDHSRLWRERNISQGKHSNSSCRGMGNRGGGGSKHSYPTLPFSPVHTSDIHMYCIGGSVLAPWEPSPHPCGAASLTIFVVGDSYGCHVHLANPSSTPMVSKGATQTDLELLFWLEGGVVIDVNTAVLHLHPSEEEKAANTDRTGKATQRPSCTSLSRAAHGSASILEGALLFVGLLLQCGQTTQLHETQQQKTLLPQTHSSLCNNPDSS